MTPKDKIDAMLSGKAVITNDAEMDAMLALDGDTLNLVRSIHNPNRVGVRDQYVAWIGDSMTPPEVK